jgi:hypothetical protein
MNKLPSISNDKLLGLENMAFTAGLPSPANPFVPYLLAEAFYKPINFWAGDDVNVLYPNFRMNKYVGIFIATVIR